MKVKITQDNGDKKEFSCEAIALASQEGKNTIIQVLGSVTALQWTCILAGLDDAKENIEKNNPIAAALSAIHAAAKKKEEEDDES